MLDKGVQNFMSPVMQKLLPRQTNFSKVAYGTHSGLTIMQVDFFSSCVYKCVFFFSFSCYYVQGCNALRGRSLNERVQFHVAEKLKKNRLKRYENQVHLWASPEEFD